MKLLNAAPAIMAAGLLFAVPAFAQTAQKQATQDGATPTSIGPASGASKQKTQDGASPTAIGPGSGAYKQRTQDGATPTAVGPASGAYKQRTQSMSHSDPGSRALAKQD